MPFTHHTICIVHTYCTYFRNLLEILCIILHCIRNTTHFKRMGMVLQCVLPHVIRVMHASRMIMNITCHDTVLLMNMSFTGRRVAEKMVDCFATSKETNPTSLQNWSVEKKIKKLPCQWREKKATLPGFEPGIP